MWSRRYEVHVAVQLGAERDQDRGVPRRERKARQSVLRRVDRATRGDDAIGGIGLEAIQNTIGTDGNERVGRSRDRLETANDSIRRTCESCRTEREPRGIRSASRGSRGAELVELRVEAENTPLATVARRVGDDRRVHPATAVDDLAAVLARCANRPETRERRHVGLCVESRGNARINVERHDRGCDMVV